MHSHHSKSLLGAGSGPLYLALPSVGTTATLLGLFLFTAFHFWLASILPPAPDELYFWVFSQNLQSSYFDNPPMVAYFIRLSTSLFGNSLLAIRLPAILSSLIVFVILLLLTPRGKLAWLVFFCPVALYGSVLMTTDVPLILFWLLYTLWFASTNATLDTWNSDPITRVYQNSPVPWSRWILGGVLLAGGGLSKYTMLLAIPCGVVVLATRTRFRAWGLGYALHLLVAGVLVMPVFFYNWKYDFAPFAFQWNHGLTNHFFSFSRWMGFLGNQVLLIGALPLLILPWILVRRRDLCADARSQVYFWFFVMPFLFFLYRGFRSPMEANWTLVAYLSFWPAADRLLSWTSFKGAVRVLLVIAFAVPVVASLLTLIHLVRPLSQLPPQRDRVAVSQGQWDAAQQVAREFQTRGVKLPLYLPNYQWTSYFRYLKVPSHQAIPQGRASQFTLGANPTCAGSEMWALDDYNQHSPAMGCFKHREVLRAFPVSARGQTVAEVWLSRYHN